MIEQITALVSQWYESLVPFVVVDEYDQGLILRFGKFNRILETGFNWKIPLIDEAQTETCVLTTLETPSQTLTTSDEESVVVSAIVRYKINGIKEYLLDMYDQEDTLRDVTMGVIKDTVSEYPLSELVHLDGDKVTKRVRKIMNPYGFKIVNVSFVDVGKLMSIRLIQE